MSRFGHSRGGYPDRRRAQAEAAKAQQVKLLEKLQQAALKTSDTDLETSPAGTDRSRFQAALRAISLKVPDKDETLHPAEVYCQLATAVDRCVSGGKSESVLCWPAANVSVAASYVLAVLAAWEDCDCLPAGSGDGSDEPKQLRALFYPWSTRTRLALNNIYVCKDALHRVHKRHLQRYGAGNTTTDGLRDLHLSLIRVKDLDGRAVDGERHVEFLNPTLNELVPSGPCGNDLSHRSGLLHRIKSKTQLKFLSSMQQADAPNTAPYYLFGAHAHDDLKRDFARLPSSVNIILLDLTRSGRNRFGDDWKAPVKTMLAAARSQLPGIPVLAITDDPWVHRDLIWRLLKEHDAQKGKRPAKESAIFVTDSAIADSKEATRSFSGCAEITARAFAGNLEVLLSRLGELKARAAKLEDAQADALLGDLASLLRRCANLPGGVSDLGSYVADEAGDIAATHIMSAYQAPKLLSELERLEGALAQSRRGHISNLCRDARAVWDTQCTTSPMASLLADVLKQFLRKSSKTVVLFRKQMLCDYTTAALIRHLDIGEAIQRRLDTGMLRFVDEIGFREATGLPPRERHQIYTAIMVCPTRLQVLAHMTDAWLPNEAIILADATTLAAIARDAEQLARYPAFAPFSDRLNKLRAATHSAAEDVSGRKVSLSADIAPPRDIDFPTAKVVDLSGTSKSGQEVLVKLETDDRQTILARQRTKLVAYDGDTAVPTYRPLLAHDTHVGDTICVISDDFVDMARTKLDIACAASEEMRAYHHLISGLYSKLPGTSERARRQHLAGLINGLRTSSSEREISDDAVRYWVDLEDQLLLPLEEVTPHAPQDWPTFQRLMAALGISAPLAQRYWNWAVIATRSSRLKAAHRLHEAYLGILISPHAAEAENPKRVADIRALRAAAEGFVAKIESKTMIERASLCA